MMRLEEILPALREGAKATRRGWNGPDQYIAIQYPDAGSVNTMPYCYIHPTQGGRVPWICSQTDFLADDWEHA